MSRSRYIAFFAVLLLLVPLGIASSASASHQAPTAKTKYWPALLPQQVLWCGVKSHTRTIQCRVGLVYSGGANFNYPALGTKDIIPAIRSTVFLPKGAKIVGKPSLTVSFPSDRIGNTAAYKVVNGRPVWYFYHLLSGRGQAWNFLVRLITRTKPNEIGVVVQPLVKHAPAVKNHFIIPAVPFTAAG